MKFFLDLSSEFWIILNASSLYLLIGFFIAGFIHIFISSENVLKYLGKGKIKSVFLASLLGVPIPLCSCGVIPAAAMLRKKGANKGATISFLISTPESGVTSIAMSYALIDTIMAVARPISAFITAFCAGLIQNVFFDEKKEDLVEVDMKCEIDGCCDGKDCSEEEHRNHHSFFEKIKYGLLYSFGEFLEDIAKPLFFGLIAAALVSYFVPATIVNDYLGETLIAKFVMLVIGIPLYICASASTPIAAALILKGMSPGTALVFLMAGPATNIASINVVSRIIGKKSTVIYILAIAIFSILLGILLDFFYKFVNVVPSANISSQHNGTPSLLSILSSCVLLFFILKSFYKSFTYNSNKKCCNSKE